MLMFFAYICGVYRLFACWQRSTHGRIYAHRKPFHQADLQDSLRMSEPTSPLADRVRAADPDALSEYLELHRAQLTAFIERKLGPALRAKIEPDDLIQEVHMECHRSLAEIDLGDREPFSWLCQVAERRIIDAHRHFFGAQKRDAGREVSLGKPVGDASQALIHLIAASITSPSKAFSRGQREFRLLEAMDQLPEDARKAIELRYGQGLPTKEVASELGKSDGAVRVLLTRTLKKLQEILSEDEGTSLL